MNIRKQNKIRHVFVVQINTRETMNTRKQNKIRHVFVVLLYNRKIEIFLKILQDMIEFKK